jgi:hypothetical protein
MRARIAATASTASISSVAAPRSHAPQRRLRTILSFGGSAAKLTDKGVSPLARRQIDRDLRQSTALEAPLLQQRHIGAVLQHFLHHLLDRVAQAGVLLREGPGRDVRRENIVPADDRIVAGGIGDEIDQRREVAEIAVDAAEIELCPRIRGGRQLLDGERLLAGGLAVLVGRVQGFHDGVAAEKHGDRLAAEIGDRLVLGLVAGADEDAAARHHVVDEVDGLLALDRVADAAGGHVEALRLQPGNERGVLAVDVFQLEAEALGDLGQKIGADTRHLGLVGLLELDRREGLLRADRERAARTKVLRDDGRRILRA